ncbi:MAG: 2-hydroxyacid dehydrogenase [Thermomicrobiales bacterium]
MSSKHSRSHRVVYLEPIPPAVEAIIRERVPAGFEVAFRREGNPVTEAVAEADFVLVATTRLTGEVIGHASRLRLIQHQGVGYDNIDLAAARARCIPVAICPAGTSIGVAEHVFLLLLAIYKRLLEADASLRRGEWLQWALRPTSFEIAGKTIGLVGLGRIGREVATRARAFAADVVYFDSLRPDPAAERDLGVAFLPFNELLAIADVISLHVPLTPETRHLIDAEALAKMKPTAVLINTARGPLIDETALVAALRANRILGAGLDVFATEPPPADHPLFSLPTAVVTPHIAAGTADALRTKMDACFANMRRVAAGADPADRIA